MTTFIDKNGSTLEIDRPSGPGRREFGATITINSGLPFHLTETQAWAMRRDLECLLQWDNDGKVKP